MNLGDTEKVSAKIFDSICRRRRCTFRAQGRPSLACVMLLEGWEGTSPFQREKFLRLNLIETVALLILAWEGHDSAQVEAPANPGFQAGGLSA